MEITNFNSLSSLNFQPIFMQPKKILLITNVSKNNLRQGFEGVPNCNATAILTAFVDATIVVFDRDLYNKNSPQSRYRSQPQGFSGVRDRNCGHIGRNCLQFPLISRNPT